MAAAATTPSSMPFGGAYTPSPSASNLTWPSQSSQSPRSFPPIAYVERTPDVDGDDRSVTDTDTNSGDAHADAYPDFAPLEDHYLSRMSSRRNSSSRNTLTQQHIFSSAARRIQAADLFNLSNSSSSNGHSHSRGRDPSSSDHHGHARSSADHDHAARSSFLPTLPPRRPVMHRFAIDLSDLTKPADAPRRRDLNSWASPLRSDLGASLRATSSTSTSISQRLRRAIINDDLPTARRLASHAAALASQPLHEEPPCHLGPAARRAWLKQRANLAMQMSTYGGGCSATNPAPTSTFSIRNLAPLTADAHALAAKAAAAAAATGFAEGAGTAAARVGTGAPMSVIPSLSSHSAVNASPSATGSQRKGNRPHPLFPRESIEAEKQSNKTSLQLALEYGCSIEMIDWLLEMGHEGREEGGRGDEDDAAQTPLVAFTRDDVGRTVIHLAAIYNRADVVSLYCAHVQYHLSADAAAAAAGAAPRDGEDRSAGADDPESSPPLVLYDDSVATARPREYEDEVLQAASMQAPPRQSLAHRPFDVSSSGVTSGGTAAGTTGIPWLDADYDLDLDELVNNASPSNPEDARATIARILDCTETTEAKTALHEAALRGHEDVVRVLLDLGCSINQPDLYGNTPLHYASSYGHLTSVQLLIERGGASFGLRNDGGFSAADYAFTASDRAALEAFGRKWFSDMKGKRKEFHAAAAGRIQFAGIGAAGNTAATATTPTGPGPSPSANAANVGGHDAGVHFKFDGFGARPSFSEAERTRRSTGDRALPIEPTDMADTADTTDEEDDSSSAHNGFSYNAGMRSLTPDPPAPPPPRPMSATSIFRHGSLRKGRLHHHHHHHHHLPHFFHRDGHHAHASDDEPRRAPTPLSATLFSGIRGDGAHNPSTSTLIKEYFGGERGRDRDRERETGLAGGLTGSAAPSPRSPGFPGNISGERERERDAASAAARLLRRSSSAFKGKAGAALARYQNPLSPTSAGAPSSTSPTSTSMSTSSISGATASTAATTPTPTSTTFGASVTTSPNGPGGAGKGGGAAGGATGAAAPATAAAAAKWGRNVGGIQPLPTIAASAPETDTPASMAMSASMSPVTSSSNFSAGASQRGGGQSHGHGHGSKATQPQSGSQSQVPWPGSNASVASNFGSSYGHSHAHTRSHSHSTSMGLGQGGALRGLVPPGGYAHGKPHAHAHGHGHGHGHARPQRPAPRYNGGDAYNCADDSGTEELMTPTTPVPEGGGGAARPLFTFSSPSSASSVSSSMASAGGTSGSAASSAGLALPSGLPAHIAHSPASGSASASTSLSSSAAGSASTSTSTTASASTSTSDLPLALGPKAGAGTGSPSAQALQGLGVGLGKPLPRRTTSSTVLGSGSGASSSASNSNSNSTLSAHGNGNGNGAVQEQDPAATGSSPAPTHTSGTGTALAGGLGKAKSSWRRRRTRSQSGSGTGAGGGTGGGGGAGGWGGGGGASRLLNGMGMGMGRSAGKDAKGEPSALSSAAAGPGAGAGAGAAAGRSSFSFG